MSSRFFAAFAAGLLLFSGAVHAQEELYCEVMTVEGTATLSNATTSGKILAEGDLLTADDVIHVGASSYVDLAYDKDWNNVTRVEENSSIHIRSLSPPEVALETGGLFAKLKALPKDSSFNVQTPTAIASVRGTEYRTTYLEGETQVYNVSNSDVYVYGVDASGQKQEAESVVVRNAQKTFVPRRGEAPMAPRRMEQADIQRAANFRQGIEQKIKQNVERGRVGKLPNVGEIGRRIQERQQNRPGRPKTLSGEEASSSARRLRGSEGEVTKGGLAEPFFPGGERRRRDADPKPIARETQNTQDFQRDHEGGFEGKGIREGRPQGQKSPQGVQGNRNERPGQRQGKSSQARAAGRPRNS